jgi:glutamate-5-semialdehyde dehydrogenase
VHSALEDSFVPKVVAALHEHGVTVHGDDAFQRASADVVPVTEEDHATEYLGMEISAAAVPDLDAALAHIRRYATGHTEAVVTDSVAVAHRFTTELDSAALMVNASTRYTDGEQLGVGAEIGISTQKLHARGPMGLSELTTTTTIVTGQGHVR